MLEKDRRQILNATMHIGTLLWIVFWGPGLFCGGSRVSEKRVPNTLFKELCLLNFTTTALRAYNCCVPRYLCTLGPQNRPRPKKYPGGFASPSTPKQKTPSHFFSKGTPSDIGCSGQPTSFSKFAAMARDQRGARASRCLFGRAQTPPGGRSSNHL